MIHTFPFPVVCYVKTPTHFMLICTNLENSHGIPRVYFIYLFVSVRQNTLDEMVLLVNVIDGYMIAGGFTSPWQMVETLMKCHGTLAAFHQCLHCLRRKIDLQRVFKKNICDNSIYTEPKF